MKKLILATCASLFSTVCLAAPAMQTEVVEQSRHGDWAAVLYKNLDNKSQFCGLEVESGRTVFRVVKYRETGDTFLEILDPGWDLIPTKRVKFDLEVVTQKENLSAELSGRRSQKSYSYDFSDAKVFRSFLDLIGADGALKFLNSNGQEIAQFSGKGSASARMAFEKCMAGKGTAEASVPRAPATPAPGSYPAALFKGPYKSPDFSGPAKDIAAYRTRIRQGIKAGPNFAGRYALVAIGCGTQCLFFPMVDLKTGLVSAFPLGGENNMQLNLKFEVGSRLVRAMWIADERCKGEDLVWTGTSFSRTGEEDLGPDERCHEAMRLEEPSAR